MISIIIPIYKAEAYLKECLLSIQKQTYTDFEAICVNDGSPDNSAIICQEVSDQDSRFILINQENGGVSSARNRALKEAKGEYVCFVDSDDMIEPHYLENLLNLAKDGAFAVCSYSRDVTKLTNSATHITEYDAKVFIRHILNESIEHPNIWMMLFKNSIIQMQHLDFTLGCVRNEDTEFYMKYLINEEKVIVSDYKGYYYRDNENSAVHQFNIKSLTYIDADARIAEVLKEKGIIGEDNLIVPSSVQYFVYQTARQGNKDLYEYIHNHYPVKQMMKQMTVFPRIARKCVAFCYLFLGKKIFYKLISLV